MEKERNMLNDVRCGQEFWAEVVGTTCYLVNRSPSSTLDDKTPHEVWFGKKPSLQHLRVFGCDAYVGRLIVVIDVNPSHGFWTARLIKVFGHEGKCTCIYNTHEWIVYIMLFPMVCGTSHGSSWLRRNEFLKMTM
jgi:hypothetical protein